MGLETAVPLGLVLHLVLPPLGSHLIFNPQLCPRGPSFHGKDFVHGVQKLTKLEEVKAEDSLEHRTAVFAYRVTNLANTVELGDDREEVRERLKMRQLKVPALTEHFKDLCNLVH